eukprot:gene18886-61945_t
MRHAFKRDHGITFGKVLQLSTATPLILRYLGVENPEGKYIVHCHTADASYDESWPEPSQRREGATVLHLFNRDHDKNIPHFEPCFPGPIAAAGSGAGGAPAPAAGAGGGGNRWVGKWSNSQKRYYFYPRGKPEAAAFN